MSGGAKDCRDCKNIGAACAVGGLCFDGKSRCPRFEFAFQYDDEFHIFGAAIHPANWQQNGMGPARLDIRGVMQEISLTAPELSPAALLPLIKSAALGLSQGLAAKVDKG